MSWNKSASCNNLTNYLGDLFYFINKIGAVSPEFITPVEMEALAYSNISETTVIETGISECSTMST